MTADTPKEFLELKTVAIERVEYYVRLAYRKLNVQIEIPQVRFDIRGRVAGRASYTHNFIRLNPVLLRENPDDFVNQTIGHEVAHLIARFQNVNIKPHGKEWRNVMWAFSLPAKRCHNYDLATVRGGPRKPKISEIRTENGLVIKPNSGGRIIEFD